MYSAQQQQRKSLGKFHRVDVCESLTRSGWWTIAFVYKKGKSDEEIWQISKARDHQFSTRQKAVDCAEDLFGGPNYLKKRSLTRRINIGADTLVLGLLIVAATYFLLGGPSSCSNSRESPKPEPTLRKK